MKGTLIVLGLCVLFVVPMPAKGEKMPVDTTICEIMAHPARFNGTLVRIWGSVYRPASEITIIVDDNCPLETLSWADDLDPERDGAVGELRRSIEFMYERNEKARTASDRLTVVARLVGTAVVDPRHRKFEFVPKSASDVRLRPAPIAIWSRVRPGLF